MIKWGELLPGSDPINVNRIDIVSLSHLYRNCLTMGDNTSYGIGVGSSIASSSITIGNYGTGTSGSLQVPTRTPYDNSNVHFATHHPDTWFDDIVEDILDNVSFIVKSPVFALNKLSNGTITNTSYSCDSIQFDDISELKKFMKDNGQFSLLFLFCIVKCVDLDKLKVFWKMRYKIVEDKERSRDKKIDTIIN